MYLLQMLKQVNTQHDMLSHVKTSEERRKEAGMRKQTTRKHLCLLITRIQQVHDQVNFHSAHYLASVTVTQRHEPAPHVTTTCCWLHKCFKATIFFPAPFQLQPIQCSTVNSRAWSKKKKTFPKFKIDAANPERPAEQMHERHPMFPVSVLCSLNSFNSDN